MFLTLYLHVQLHMHQVIYTVDVTVYYILVPSQIFEIMKFYEKLEFQIMFYVLKLNRF